MKRGFGKFVAEQTEASKEAANKGLMYKGFGMYADPRTGEVVAKSVNGKLQPVEDTFEDEDQTGPSAEMMAGQGGDDEAAGGSEVQQGAVLPGEEKAPEETEWKAGPDGDTMPEEEEDDVPTDVFVQKTNSPDWEAGPDGDNYSTFSFDSFQEAALNEAIGKNTLQQGQTQRDDADGSLDYEQRQLRKVGRQLRRGDEGDTVGQLKQNKHGPTRGLNAMGAMHGMKPHQVDPNAPLPGQAAKDKAAKLNLKSDGHGYWLDAQNNPVAKTVSGDLVMLSDQEKQKLAGGGSNPQDAYINKAGGVEQQVRGERPIAGTQQGGIIGTAVKMGKAVRAQAGHETRKKIDAHLGGDKRLDGGSDDHTIGDYTKMIRMHRKLQKLPKTVEDMHRTEELNQEAKNYVTDTSYNLDDTGEELGSGVFGSVYMGKDKKSVVKDGQIGLNEMQALDMMKDSVFFPRLINARFQGPFQHQSVEDNLSDYGDPSDPSPSEAPSKFWNPSEASDFDGKFPTAPGRFAMSLANGRDWTDIKYQVTEEQHEMIADQVMLARKAMHKNGIAHWDMHGGNIYVDDSGEIPKVQVLDLGMAQNNYMAALMEALGGTQGMRGADTQLADGLDSTNTNEFFQLSFEDNLQKVKKMIAEDNGLGEAFENDDWDYQDEDTYATLIDLDNIMEGGIRDGQVVSMRDYKNLFPSLQDDRNIKKYIDRLYKDIEWDEVEDPDGKKTPLKKRMSDAYDERKTNTYKVHMANQIRKERGEDEIDIKNPEVIPPKNLDMTRPDAS